MVKAAATDGALGLGIRGFMLPASFATENHESNAGNGLLHRRAFLRGGLAAAMTGYALEQSSSAQKLADDPWSVTAGATVPDYGTRWRYEKDFADAQQSQSRAAHSTRAHAAPSDQRSVL